PPPPPPPGERPEPGGGGTATQWPRWSLWILVGVIGASVLLTSLVGGDSGESISYDDFMQEVSQGQVKSITFDNSNAHIEGERDDGSTSTTTGPLPDVIAPHDLQ